MKTGVSRAGRRTLNSDPLLAGKLSGRAGRQAHRLREMSDTSDLIPLGWLEWMSLCPGLGSPAVAGENRHRREDLLHCTPNRLEAFDSDEGRSTRRSVRGLRTKRGGPGRVRVPRSLMSGT